MSNNLLKNSSRDILNVSNLSIQYHLFGGEIVKAVDDVSFLIKEGETLGLVGESGSGKSTIARLIMRLIEPTSGNVYFMNNDIFKMSKKEVRLIRRKMGMIFQDPSSALNPKMMIKDLVGEPLKLHKIEKEDILERVKEVLEKVNLLSSYMYRYPRELSGGEKQRIVIARALITNPKLIIADEPTSALDVSTQAQILELMKQLQKEFNFSCLLISHDLAVVRYISNRVAIMYMGKIMELASSKEIIKNPLHPYTEALYSATPEAKPTIEKKRIILKGTLPSPINPPKGCRFNTRCYKAEEKCFKETPELIEIKNGHFVACHLI
ncbi:MAG: ABC transporter ATP-binding protein [Nitrososphaerota archaeon]